MQQSKCCKKFKPYKLNFLNGKSNLIESLFLECSIELAVEKEIQVVVSLL